MILQIHKSDLDFPPSFISSWFLPVALIGGVQHRGHGAGFDDLPTTRQALPFGAHDDY
jgi:hypothetical protein